MRKIGFVQTAHGEKEMLPRTYGIETLAARRKMCLTMINDSLRPEERFSLQNDTQFSGSLHAIFKAKIFSFFQMHGLRPERAQRVTRIYAKESLLFNHYFKTEQDPKACFFARATPAQTPGVPSASYIHPAASLIRLIFDGAAIGLSLELDSLFAQTVYRRIKRDKETTVSLDLPYIHIDSHGVRTRLYPRWKRLDPTNAYTRQRTLREGRNHLRESGVHECYFIYPKTEKFRRHIEVRTEAAGRVKVVPYSFTFCVKSGKCGRKTKAQKRSA